ncbi:MAG: SDR family oxidoreductase [Rhodospirillales bacterium]|nr:SDR family oxidoreductase [Rhodospirillales bacterium]
MAQRMSLVTGGAGFIGQHLVQQLLERGERVRVLDIADSTFLGPEVEVFRGSILDSDIVGRALNKVDRLYHLAANPNLWSARKEEFEEVNVQGTRTVLAQAEAAGLERIVYCSTESIIERRHPAASRATEPAPTVNDMPGPYCRSKFLAQEEALKAAARNMPLVIVNPTLPVGPGDRFLTPPTRMLQIFLDGRTPAFLDCQFNMIDVRDAAFGHILAAERGRPGELYVLGGENLRLRDVLAMLEEITGLTMPGISIPYWMAFAFSAASEFIADHVSGRPPVAPLAGVRLARKPMIFDSAKAVRELGLPQRPIRQALADAVGWMIEEGLLCRLPDNGRKGLPWAGGRGKTPKILGAK